MDDGLRTLPYSVFDIIIIEVAADLILTGLFLILFSVAGADIKEMKDKTCTYFHFPPFRARVSRFSGHGDWICNYN